MKISDQQYLKTEQYKNAANLEARIALHRRFGNNPYGWMPFVMDQLRLEPGMRVLEVGCGPAGLWKENEGRFPEDLTVILGDLSQGMVSTAREGVGRNAAFRFLAVDAQNLPFPTAHFERVVANHMLYHVPDIAQAVREFKRVLRPGGVLCAATNGEKHMRELTELILEFEPRYVEDDQVRRYSLENALDRLGMAFGQLRVIPYPENLVVTEFEPLLRYVLSMWGVVNPDTEERRAELAHFLRSRFDAAGGRFQITKSQGVILARKER